MNFTLSKLGHLSRNLIFKKLMIISDILKSLMLEYSAL